MAKIENGISNYLENQTKNPFGPIYETLFEVKFEASRMTEDFSGYEYEEKHNIRKEFISYSNAQEFMNNTKKGLINGGWSFNSKLCKILRTEMNNEKFFKI